MRHLVWLSLAAGLPAQGSWSSVSTPSAPPGNSTAMAFDATRNVTVALAWSSSALQVWERSAGNWALRGTGPFTNFRANHALAHDSLQAKTLFFPGGSSDGGANDVVAWDGSVWSPLAPPASPPVRTRHAVAFDAARAVTVLFGGAAAQSNTLVVRQDTWTFDGSVWTQRFPATFPAVRAGHALAYDSARQRVVLFGGATVGLASTGNRPPEVFYGDTWEWDGSNWFERSPQGATPSPRHEHALAYDPTAQVTYLFGGLDAAGDPLNDLWTWDGSRWTQLMTPNPPARRFDCAMTFDAARGKLVLFGGTNSTWSVYRLNETVAYLRDTWEYTPGAAGAFTAFGVGCSGSRGVPTLGLQGALPTAGFPLRVQVSNLPLVTSAYVFVGTSNTFYGSLPLPFPLASIGMPTCTLYVGADVLLPLPVILGIGLLAVDLPLGTAGATLYVQAFPIDFGANPLGLTASDAAQVLIGG